MKVSEIKTALPKYIPLIAGIHKLKRGDQWEDSNRDWHNVKSREDFTTNDAKVLEYYCSWYIGDVPLNNIPQFRRPIPDEVLEHQAWNIATLGMDELEKILVYGEAMYRKMFADANTYDSWIGEQIL